MRAENKNPTSPRKCSCGQPTRTPKTGHCKECALDKFSTASSRAAKIGRAKQSATLPRRGRLPRRDTPAALPVPVAPSRPITRIPLIVVPDNDVDPARERAVNEILARRNRKQ